jgi:hypothetical protein
VSCADAFGQSFREVLRWIPCDHQTEWRRLGMLACVIR